MLKRAWVAGAVAALVFWACSSPDGYPGGGRYETLPGQAGGLIPVDAGPPNEAGLQPPGTDASE